MHKGTERVFLSRLLLIMRFCVGWVVKPILAHEKAYAVICSNCTLGEMTAQGWECAARIYAELYSKHFTVNDADILNAAFAIVNGYTLVTSNTKDFENIDGLQKFKVL